MLLFLAIISALTILACLAVLLPYTRTIERSPAASHDIEVYRDQLAELDRDEAAGLIGGPEAEEARTEIGRRILKAAGPAYATSEASRRAGRWIVLAAIAAIPVISWGMYAFTGSPELPGQPLASRLARDPAENTIEELIARAEQHLANNPEDGRGWDVLAPVYARIQRHDSAVSAFGNAIRINGETPDRLAGMGEALVGANGGVVVAEAQEAFDRTLELEPANAKARFYLALAKAQDGKVMDAVADWNAMIAELPADSPWKTAASDAISRSAEFERPGGPGQDEIAAASQMDPADRRKMIDNMVESLARKLEQDPLDPEGWQRLVRSYVVLDEPDAAAAALERGKTALAEDPSALEELVRFAAELGVKMEQAP